MQGRGPANQGGLGVVLVARDRREKEAEGDHAHDHLQHEDRFFPARHFRKLGHGPITARACNREIARLLHGVTCLTPRAARCDIPRRWTVPTTCWSSMTTPRSASCWVNTCS